MRARTFPLLLPWQVHEEAARQTSKHSVVQVERPVSSTDYNHVAFFGGLQPVHLLHELGDNTAVRDGSPGLPGSHPGTEERVDFIDEDDTGRKPAGKCEHRANEFLAFSDVLKRFG